MKAYLFSLIFICSLSFLNAQIVIGESGSLYVHEFDSSYYYEFEEYPSAFFETELDLDLDGIIDFKIINHHSNGLGGGSGRVSVEPHGENMIAYSRKDTLYNIDSLLFPSRPKFWLHNIVDTLEIGDTLDNDLKYDTANAILIANEWTEFHGSFFLVEDWLGIGPNYLGFLIVKDTEIINIGWLKMEYYRVLQKSYFNIIGYALMNPPMSIDTKEQNEKIELVLFPNPAQEVLNISFYSKYSGKMICKVFDLYGVLIQEREVMVISGDNTIDLNMQSMKEGSYIFQITNSDTSTARRFSIVRCRN